MLVRDVLDRIRFATATTNDLTGRSANNMFSNKNIVQQLKFALDKYAQYTLAIEDIYSYSIPTTTQTISMPPDALRSETYKFLMYMVNGRIYPIDFKDVEIPLSEFPYQSIQGIPRWFLAWGSSIYIFPHASNTYNTTTLSSAVSLTDTTLTVASTASFPSYYGRITIGSEKILFTNKTSTQFLGCTRGVEGTTASTHSASDSVYENNLQIFYRKKHFEIPMLDDNVVDDAYLNMEMEVCDEHIEVITDYVAYKLLLKVDPSRAVAYKVNFEDWLKEAKMDIKKKRGATTRAGSIREPYYWESQNRYPYA